MKSLPPLLLAVLLTAFHLHAQAPVPPAAGVNPAAKPAPATPAGDPFVRDSRAPKASAKSEPAVPPVFHTLVLETYTLPTAEFAAILAQESSDTARHGLVVALHAAGKARLTDLTAHCTRSGQRCSVESIDEVRYGTEFQPSGSADEPPTPTTFATKNTGASIEDEYALGEDGQHGKLNFALKRNSFLGMREYSWPAGDPPVAVPMFSASEMSHMTDLRIGEPTLLGSASTPRDGGAGSDSWITFATAKPMKIEPLANTGKASSARLSIEFSLYSLDRAQARQVLADAAAPGDIHRRIAALAAEGKSQLERLLVCSAFSGQRGIAEEGSEFQYPTEFDPSGRESGVTESTHRTVSTSTKRPSAKAGAKEEETSREIERTETTENTTHSVSDPKAPRTPGNPTTFEIRNLGIQVEAEPILGETGIGEMSLVLSEVRILDPIKFTGVAAKYPFQPHFETRKTTQTVPLVRGVQVFVGTLNAPPANGVNDRKDDGRAVLVFVRLTGGQP